MEYFADDAEVLSHYTGRLKIIRRITELETPYQGVDSSCVESCVDGPCLDGMAEVEDALKKLRGIK